MVATPTNLSFGSEKLQTSRIRKLDLQQFSKKASSNSIGIECRKLKFGLSTLQQIWEVRSEPEPRNRHETNRFRMEGSRTVKSLPSEITSRDCKIIFDSFFSETFLFESRTGTLSQSSAARPLWTTLGGTGMKEMNSILLIWVLSCMENSFEFEKKSFWLVIK